MTDAPPLPTPPTPAPHRRARGWLFEIVETLVLTAVIFLGVQAFVAQPYKVEMVSMRDTLQNGQYVLIDKLTPRWSAYERGDIVVFDPPPGWTGPPGIPLIKRVIGLPGDRVALRDGKVLVNGRALDEPYLFALDGVAQATEPLGGATSWTVASGQLFVMGDHRQQSEDSRAFGPIQVSSVLGRAVIRYWPIDALELIQRPTYR